MLCRSIPAAPLLAFPFSHAAFRFLPEYTLSISANPLPPFTPSSSAVNMRSVHTEGSTHLHLLRIGVSPACLDISTTIAGSPSSIMFCNHPPSCLPSLHPVSGTSSLLRRLCALLRSLPHAGIPDSCAWPSFHSVSNHPLFPVIA